MNIYALEWFKVELVHMDNGYPSDQEKVKKHLRKGNVYRVLRTVVHSSITDVYLMDFPDISFNSVHFEDVVEQPIEFDRLHPDYLKYNTCK